MVTSELSSAAIAQAEDHIAYSCEVELLKWIDTSSHGFKVSLGLKDRTELDYFDGVMTMRKTRGGQRYETILTFNDAELYQHESQFCGRGWSESAGAHIAIHVSELEAISWWRQQKCSDQLEKEHRGSIYLLTLMELDDSEQIVNQAKRARQQGVIDPMPKGGPRSIAVARLMQDADWIEWLTTRSLYKTWHRPNAVRGMGYDLTTLAGRDKMVKSVLQIKSKKEFDNGNEEAWERWNVQYHRPFLHWLQRR